MRIESSIYNLSLYANSPYPTRKQVGAQNNIYFQHAVASGYNYDILDLSRFRNNPTSKEIENYINKLPNSEKEANYTAEKEVKSSIKQMKSFTSSKEYRDDLKIGAEQAEKIFDKLNNVQRIKSITLQRACIKEIKERRNEIASKSNPNDRLLLELLDIQIQMGEEVLINSYKKTFN